MNNTYLLYKKNWKGINIDLNSLSIELFNIARPKDINMLSNRIKILMEDKELRRSMGQVGRAMIDKSYNWEKAGKMFENIISDNVEIQYFSIFPFPEKS